MGSETICGRIANARNGDGEEDMLDGRARWTWMVKERESRRSCTVPVVGVQALEMLSGPKRRVREEIMRGIVRDRFETDEFN